MTPHTQQAVPLEERVVRAKKRTLVTLYGVVTQEYRTEYDLYVHWKQDAVEETHGLYVSRASAQRTKDRLAERYRTQGYRQYGSDPDHLIDVLNHEVELRIDELEIDKDLIAIDAKGRMFFDGKQIRR